MPSAHNPQLNVKKAISENHSTSTCSNLQSLQESQGWPSRGVVNISFATGGLSLWFNPDAASPRLQVSKVSFLVPIKMRAVKCVAWLWREVNVASSAESLFNAQPLFGVLVGRAIAKSATFMRLCYWSLCRLWSNIFILNLFILIYLY